MPGMAHQQCDSRLLLRPARTPLTATHNPLA